MGMNSDIIPAQNGVHTLQYKIGENEKYYY